MKHNKIIVILLAILLLIGTFVSAANIGTAGLRTQEENVPQQSDTTEIPDIPHITVAGLDVGEAYYELSLLVSAQQFQTVGVVLSYDSSVLTPIAWSSGEKDAEDNPKQMKLEGHKDWSNPVVLPSRGADKLAGKPALCYAGYTPGEDEESEPVLTDRAYLYLGADALAYTSVSEERAVTVRFLKKEGAIVTMPTEAVTSSEAENEDGFTICLAPHTSTAAKDSIPGRPVMATTRGKGVTLQSYMTYTLKGAAASPTVPPEASSTQEDGAEPGTETEPEPGEGNEGETSGEDLKCVLNFAKNPAGLESADSTGGGSGDYAITFFDWDGRVIDAIAAPENALQTVETWQTQDWIQERLGNKKGYTFDQWLIVHQEGGSLETVNGTFTSNDTELDLTNNDVEADVATDAFLSKLQETKLTTEAGTEGTSKSLLLQAAYKANTDKKFDTADLVNGGGSDTTDKYYTISDPVYTRYGTGDAIAGSYSVTLTVTRKRTMDDGTDVGVTRLREPAIWVAMTPKIGGANIMSLIRLENTDETTFEFVSTKQIGNVSCKVIDVYGTTNWTGCSDKSDVTKAQFDGQRCIALGTRGFLAQQAFSVAFNGGAWDSTVNDWAFADACLRSDQNNAATGVDARNSYTFWTDTRCDRAKSALLNKTRDVNTGVAEADRRALTYDEVLNVLKGVAA